MVSNAAANRSFHRQVGEGKVQKVVVVFWVQTNQRNLNSGSATPRCKKSDRGSPQSNCVVPTDGTPDIILFFAKTIESTLGLYVRDVLRTKTDITIVIKSRLITDLYSV